MSTQTKGVKNKNPGVHGISKYLLRSGSTSESSVLAQNKSRSEETRSNMAASTTSGKSSESVEKVNSGQGDETVTNVDLKKCIIEMINGLENKLTERMGTMEESINRSRMSPKPATNSHMTGAPKLETVAVHCGKNGVKCRRFWRRLIGFIKSPLANRIYPRLYREKFEAFLRHISNFLPCTF